MPELDCSVVNCVYNKDNCCGMDQIHVGGESAHIMSETSCNSFVSRKEDETRNCSCSCGCAAKETPISCDARDCVSNDSCKCVAGHVCIGGGHADHSRETECSSFKLR